MVLIQRFGYFNSFEGVIRTKEVDKSLGYDLNNAADIRKLLIDNPKALERPILIKNGQAVIGRPNWKISWFCSIRFGTITRRLQELKSTSLTR